jgi:hypothetical protein
MTSILNTPADITDDSSSRIRAGCLATLVMLALMVMARLTIGTLFVPELLADRISGWLPVSIVELTGQTVGFVLSTCGFLCCVLMFIAAGTEIGAWTLRRFPDLHERPVQFGVIVVAVIFWYVSLSLVIPGFAVGILTMISASLAVPVVVLLSIYLIYGFSLGPIHAWLMQQTNLLTHQRRDKTCAS